MMSMSGPNLLALRRPVALAKKRTSAAMGGWLGDDQTAVVRPFRGPRHTLESMEKLALGPRGEQSFRVRQFAETIVRYLEPKDYLGEIIAVRNVFLQRGPHGAPLFRYANDPLHVELVKDPERMVTELDMYGSTLCDCDEITCLAGTLCLTLGREVEWVAMGFSPGQLTHVGVRVKEPKSNQWIWLDAVAGPREAEAAARAKTIKFWSLS
jgi:hypothetical protein